MAESRRVLPSFPTAAWLNHQVETVIDPEQRIVDPHHHLWPAGGALPYGPADLEADADDGHHVVATVFMECGAAYRADGPEHLQPVGETEFVAASASATTRPLIRGIVGRADLRLEPGLLDEVLDAHEAAGAQMFRGIRHAGANDPFPETLTIPGRHTEGLYADASFRAGVAQLGARGLTYDTWHYHHQNRDFLELVRAVPDTTIVLDHLGTPLGVGRFAGRHDEIFPAWQDDIREIASNDHVVAKLGGMAMIDNGFGWDTAERPPTSEEFVAAQGRWYWHMIECFGPERCMFESNFPIDKYSLSYRTLWNALKLIAERYSAAERDAMFFGTANRVYRLGLS